MSKARQLAQKPSQPTGRKNIIINGAQVIDQRNSGSSVTGSSAEARYAADRFSLYANTTGTITIQQVSDAPDGFEKSNKVTCTTAASSDTSGSRVQLVQAIEGYNAAHLQFGSSNAKTITLSFWVKASNAGTYGGSFTNGVIDRSYPYQYTINAANTWEHKTVTITGDTSGTWATDNTGGLYIFWGLGVGSTYEGTANQWNGAFDIAPPSSFSLKDNLNATWQITGVQLEVGSTATEFEHRSYGEELALCQRYFFQLTGGQYNRADPAGYADTSSRAWYNQTIPVAMRTTPQMTENNLTINGTGVSSISGVNKIGESVVTYLLNYGGSHTVGSLQQSYWDGASNNYLRFDAEL